MCAFSEMVNGMEKNGQWKSYPDGSIFDVYGVEILPKAEIITDHHRFMAMTPARIEKLSDARGLALT